MDFPLTYKFGLSIFIQLFIPGLASFPGRINNDGMDQEVGILRTFIKNGRAGKNVGVSNPGFTNDDVLGRLIRKLIEREKTGQTPFKKIVSRRETELDTEKRAKSAFTERIEELAEAIESVQSIQEEINADLLDRVNNRGWWYWCSWCDGSQAIKKWDIVFGCHCPKEEARQDLDSE